MADTRAPPSTYDLPKYTNNIVMKRKNTNNNKTTFV